MMCGLHRPRSRPAHSACATPGPVSAYALLGGGDSRALLLPSMFQGLGRRIEELRKSVLDRSSRSIAEYHSTIPNPSVWPDGRICLLGAVAVTAFIVYGSLVPFDFRRPPEARNLGAWLEQIQFTPWSHGSRTGFSRQCRCRRPTRIASDGTVVRRSPSDRPRCRTDCACSRVRCPSSSAPPA